MSDWKCLSFAVVLLMKVLTTQSGCKHEIQFGPIVCILRCTSNLAVVNGSYTQGQSMAQIEYGYEEVKRFFVV